MWRDLLHGWGYQSEIVAEYVHPELTGSVRPARSRRQATGEDRPSRPALHGLERRGGGSAANRVADRSLLPQHHAGPLAARFNPNLAALCDRGRDALPRFRGRVASLIADSSFNAVDLRHAGLGDATVVPLLFELPTAVPRREPNAEPVVLTVGRIAPNKRLEQGHQGVRALSTPARAGGVARRRRPTPRVRALPRRTRPARSGPRMRRVFFTGSIPSQARDAWYATPTCTCRCRCTRASACP